MNNYVHDFRSYLISDSIKTYESYLQKNYKVEIVQALAKNNQLRQEVKFILESIQENNLYDNLWEGTITEEFINEALNEGNLGSWFADKKKKAIETIKDITSAGPEKLTAAKKVIIDKAKQTAAIFKSFGDWVGKILNAIKIGLQKLWKTVYGAVEKKFNGKESDVAKGITSKMKGKSKPFGSEVKNLGDMTSGGVKWVTGGAIEKIGAAIKDSAKAPLPESESVVSFYDVIIHETVLQCINKFGMDFIHETQAYDFLVEDSGKEVTIPGLSKLVNIMKELPIIKQLGDIEHGAAKVANTGLGKLSYVLNKVGASGGPYSFELIGAAVGLGVEYYVKTKIKGALGLDHHESDNTNSFNGDVNEGEGKTMKQYLITAGISGAVLAICILIPGFGVVFGIMKKVAEYVWWYSVFQVVAGLLLDLDDEAKKGKEISDKELEDKLAKQKEDDAKKTEDLVDTAKEEADEDLQKGGEGLDDEDKK